MSTGSKFQKTPEEFANEMKTILSANVSKTIQLMTRANNLIKEVVVSASSPKRKSMDESELMERWLNFNVSTYSVINDHALSLMEKLITIAEGSISGNPQKEEKAKKQVDINIKGHLGKKRQTMFLIQNNFDHPLDISFEASPFIAENAEMVSNKYITFDPPSTTLNKDEEKTIKVIVDISQDFIPDKMYITEIHVIGYEAKELILSLEVLPPAKPKSETRKKKKTSSTKGKTVRKKADTQKPKR